MLRTVRLTSIEGKGATMGEVQAVEEARAALLVLTIGVRSGSKASLGNPSLSVVNKPIYVQPIFIHPAAGTVRVPGEVDIDKFAAWGPEVYPYPLPWGVVESHARALFPQRGGG